MKSISTINPAIMENSECLVIRDCTSLKVGVSLDHVVSLCFISLLALRICWATFQAKHSVRSAPASSALASVSHQSQNVHTTNCHQVC